ncbi:hypothetical protein SAMN04488531_1534 [Corynebacterium coyleae]|uniref:Uncharacterized protein n=1 Tax=Corynebacterium coyleae TaxID=53374 RepID=A0ABX8KS67_9CORY|nr:hypothetical protein [Corynebacterium coyleae]QXB17735.1 hypothetical protein I6L55_07325 [Corynebacterium coyleae]WJY79139.1 hypothetical protein CCOY_02575 [Corynebacterium coyleae]SEB68590.1 hypothetical protein SAMN04488531_1534 [Corynebacterium coyleae]
MTPLFRTDDTSLSHDELAALTTVLAEAQTWQAVAGTPGVAGAAGGTGAAYEDNVFGDAFGDAFGQPFGAQQTIGNVTYF